MAILAAPPSAMVVRTITTTASLLIGANPRRKTLTISAPVTNQVTVSDRQTFAAGDGVLLVPVLLPLTLTADTHGTWMQMALRAITNAGSESIAVIETLYHE